MLLENVEWGRMIEIYVERDGYRYRLTSKVEEAGKRRVCVTLIAARGKVFQFKANDQIRLVYRDTDQMWQWDRVSASVIKLDDTAVHAFTVRDKGHSFNRRNAFRVALNEEVDLGYYELRGGRKRSAEPPDPYDEEVGMEHAADIIINGNTFSGLNFMAKPEYVRALVKDASEIGVGICTMVDLQVGDSFFFNLPTPYGSLLTKAQVIRRTELQSAAAKYRNYYGCVLLQTDNRFIRHIYDVQREQIRKQKDQKEAAEERRIAARRKKKKAMKE